MNTMNWMEFCVEIRWWAQKHCPKAACWLGWHEKCFVLDLECVHCGAPIYRRDRS